MPRLELRMFGVPRLFVDGQEVRISRQRVFECLARIVLAGETGTTRTEICRRMWRSFEPNAARAQLRGTLMKLKRELEELGVANQFDLSGEVLRALGGVSCDLARFTQDLPVDLADLKNAVRSVAETWDEENWQQESDRVADTLAQTFERLNRANKPIDTELLSNALASHPTATRLVSLLTQRLITLNRLDEANQAIIDFETAWVERFGNLDLPRLSLKPEKERTEHIPVGLRRVKLAASLALAVAIPLALTLMFKSHRSDKKGNESEVKVLSTSTQNWLGHVVVAYKISTGDSRVQAIRRLSDGTVVIRISDPQGEEDHMISPKGLVWPAPPIRAILDDRLRDSILINESPRSVQWISQKHSTRFTAPSGFYWCSGVGLPAPNQALLSYVSGDPDHSHSKMVLAGPEGTRIIEPAGPEPRTVAETYTDHNDIFLKYSMGHPDKWRYRGALYNLKTGRLTPLRHVVVYRSSKKTLVSFDQDVYLDHEDYVTSPKGHVLLASSNGVRNEGSHIELAGCFDDSLILLTGHTTVSKQIKAIPIDAKALRVTLPSQVQDIFVAKDGKALIYREFNRLHDRGEYNLLVDSGDSVSSVAER